MMSDIFERAVIFAMQKHHGAVRKAEDMPEIMHPLEAAVIAATMTSDPEVLAASVLHDTVEDTDTSADEIRREFGDRVCFYVEAATEDKHRGIPASDTWEIRKKEALKVLAETDDNNVRIIWLADKLANVRSFCRSYMEKGDDMWNLFHQNDPKKQAWYYYQVRDLTRQLKQQAAWQEYSRCLNILFQGDEDETD